MLNLEHNILEQIKRKWKEEIIEEDLILFFQFSGTTHMQFEPNVSQFYASPRTELCRLNLQELIIYYPR